MMRIGREPVGMNRNMLRALAWLLCLALMLAPASPAFAAEQITIRAVSGEEAELPAAPETPETPETEAGPSDSLLDNAAITEMVQDFLQKKNIPADRVGIGYCYTATGEEWFHNPDTWFYPGSMYKVPLMMLLSERIREGEVGKDTQIGGLNLDTVFEYILVNSNNDYAHMVRKFLIDGQGGDEIWREQAKQYARLDSYDERYLLYCYFSPRYMTQVLETLCQDPDRFPGVTEKLLKAEPAHYFRLSSEMNAMDIAQKYGSYLDQEGSNWNHTAGIIYTEHPFILTVMTKNVGGYESVIGELAVLFKDYTQGLDKTYDAWRQEQEAKEARQLAAEQPALQSEQAAQPQEPGATVWPVQSTTRPNQPETQLQTPTADRAARGQRAGIIVLSFLLAAAIIGGVGAVIIVKERERRRYESYRRRFEEELRQEAMAKERAARAGSQQQRPRPAEARPPQPGTPGAQTVRRPAQPARPRTPQPNAQQPQPSAPQAKPQPSAPQIQRQAPSFDRKLWDKDEEDE